MSQVYQTQSKESTLKLEKLIIENQAVQFLMSIVAQKLSNISAELQNPTLSTATFSLIKEKLAQKSSRLHTLLSRVFSGE